MESLYNLTIRKKRKIGIALSSGAFIGSLYCSGTDIKEMESYAESMDWRSFLLFTDLILARKGIINGRRVEEALEKIFSLTVMQDIQNNNESVSNAERISSGCYLKK